MISFYQKCIQKRYINNFTGQNVHHRQNREMNKLRTMKMLEIKLIYILKKYEEQLANVRKFVVYKDACKKHIEGFDTQEFIVRANLTFFNLSIRPIIEIKSWEQKFSTTLFSLMIEEEKGELMISIHFTQNQFLYSELRKIPGLTE